MTTSKTTQNRHHLTQSGFTLIELVIVVTIIGILAAIGAGSYQIQVRRAQLTMIHQELSHFRLPYQVLMNEGAGVTDFSPAGLNVAEKSKYCQFSVIAPNKNDITLNAVTCQIQNLSYLSNETLSLDLAVDGQWYCRASTGISKSYLPQDCQ